ncbi:fimbrial protein [Providencia huaxiensis]|uniref:fimbrial protein n=1 Tax=Providencia huaxiensis TaxID=2027290 RepID=UPI0034E609D0
MKKIYLLWITLFANYTSAYIENIESNDFRGEVFLKGNIVSSPCSIGTDSQYQYIDYNSASTNTTNTDEKKIETRKPFNIKLNDCISKFNNNKGMNIKFFAPQDSRMDAIKLSGPKTGVLLYIYDEKNNLLSPNKSYSISNSSIYFDEKTKTSFLKYETEINTLDNEAEPGDYFTIIKFNITYD